MDSPVHKKKRLRDLLSMNNYKLKQALARRGSNGAYWQTRTKNSIANDLATRMVYQQSEAPSDDGDA